MAETHLNDLSKVYLEQIAERTIEELYKGKHGQTDKQYADSRSQGGKMVSGDSKMSGAEYTHGRRVKVANPGMQPDVGGKTKPKSQGKMDKGTRADLEYRKANLKKEEIEVEEGYKEISFDKHQKMYNRYKSLSKAAMKDARDSGEASGDNRRKMGKMSDVLDKSSENLRKKQTKGELTGRGPRKEEVEQVDENRAAMGRINKEYHRKKEAEAMAARARDPKVKRDLPKRKNDNPMYDPKSAGSSRVKGFKFTGEEVELDENRRAARAAGGFVDDSKKQTDPSKKGFTGISGSIKDIMRQNKEIEARNKAKSKTESLDPVGQEDGDVNNDGKKDSSDKYLMKRRKAIAASINKKKVKESFSDWRTELSEVIGDTDVKKKSETPKIKEGNVDNASKIKINPEIKEVVEEIGGTLLEMVEIDEMDYILESVYDELIEEGFTEEDVEFGIEQALVQDLEEVTSPAAVASARMRSGNGNPKRDAGAEARSRMNISSSKPSQETKKPSFKDRLKSAAKNAIIGAGRAVGSIMQKKAQAQKSVGKVGSYIDRAKKLARQGYEQGRGPVEKKTTYRGAGVGRKEKIGEDLVNEQDAAPNEKQMLAKKKQMMLKQQMIDKQRLQMQQQGKLPTGHRTEESTYPKTIDLGMGVKRTVKSAAEEKKLRDQMSAAMGPRPGSRYRGD